MTMVQSSRDLKPASVHIRSSRPGSFKDGAEEVKASAMASKVLTCATLTYVVMQIVCEVFKQLSNYGVQYFNGGKYPVPQTSIVVLMELVKLVATVIRAKGQLPSFSTASLKSSVRFLLPSVLYALNNNIYFLGLTMVSPPIWLILCSFRTAISASIYKFVLKRYLSALQFVGCGFIVMSIITAKLPDIMGTSQSGTNAVPFMAIALATIASFNSVGAALYTETLFKSTSNVGENFLDQQFWLYAYGSVVALFVHLLSNATYGVGDLVVDIQAMSSWVLFLFVIAIFFGSIGGLVVAAILKYLDNIVKEYSGNVANIVTAIACSFLFPDKFQFTVYIMLSLTCLLSGIYMYESGKTTVAKATEVKLPKSADDEEEKLISNKQ